LFAIDDATTARLLAAKTDAAVLEIIWALDRENKTLREPIDKSWDAMHRALSDGSLDSSGGTFPLNRAILGGKQLHRGDEYIISLVTKDEVPSVANALASIDDDEMRRRYREVVPEDYAAEYGDEDREYTVEYFRSVADLYARAASAGRAVLFTVDQ
jgi:hypothetical protein